MKSKIPIIILCMITLLCLGLVYGYSIFVAPLEAEFGWARSETSLTFTISMIALCIGIMTSGRLNNTRNKPFFTLVAGAVLIAAGFIVASRSQALITFYIAYGVGVGFGVGFAYSQLISVGIGLIPGKQGTLSGILMMCYGLGALVLGAVCNVIMSVAGWRWTFCLMGILFGALLALTGLCLQLVCKDQEKTAARGSDEDEQSCLTSKQMIATADYKMFYLWLILLSAAGLALMGHIAPCAMQIGATPSAAAFLAGLTSVSNGIGRLFFGTAYDKYGVKRTIHYISVLFVIAAVVAAVAVTIGSVILLGVGCVLVGISFGSSPTSTSSLAIRFYGSKYFSSNFGITTTHLILAAFMGPYLAGRLYTVFGTYVSTFYCVIGFSLVAVIIAEIMLRVAKKNNRNLR